LHHKISPDGAAGPQSFIAQVCGKINIFDQNLALSSAAPALFTFTTNQTSNPLFLNLPFAMRVNMLLYYYTQSLLYFDRYLR
jgi:hypothetical protein